MLYYAYLENIKKDFAFWGFCFCFLAGVVGGVRVRGLGLCVKVDKIP